MVDNKKVLMIWSDLNVMKIEGRWFFDELPEELIEKKYMANGYRFPSKIILKNGLQIDFKFESMGHANFCGSRPAYIVDKRHSNRGTEFRMVDAYMRQMEFMGCRVISKDELKELICQD